MPIFAFGLDLQNGAGQDGRLSVTREMLQQLKETIPAEEFFVSQLGPSIELFAASDRREACLQSALELWQKCFGLSHASLEERLFRHDGPEAIRRFFEHFVGMDDFGIVDPSNQAFRHDFQKARDLELTGPRFYWLYQRALWLCEKVRIELSVHKKAVTPENVIADLAQKIFGALQDHSALIVAHSAECERFVQQLCDRHIGKVYFAQAENNALHTLCERYHGEILPADELRVVLPTVDVILLFDEKPVAFFAPEQLTRLMSKRKNAPLLCATLFDLPPEGNHQLDFSKLYNVYFYTRQDLKSIVAANLREHRKITALVRQLIDREIEEFVNWVRADEQYRFGAIIGKSRQMQRILELIARIAQTDASVMIDGESGTGKELVARALHEHSLRAENPFVVVNCGAMPDTLLESELFGHVRGAFTGATSNKKGLFELANHGTIFLDEIGETSQATQVKLLRFLQQGEIKPVGSNQILNLDVRVITATNRNLERMVQEGTFRQDLYYRLNVMQITVPPLRERKEDILPLATHFVKQYATKINKTIYGLDEEVEEILLHYDWRGNVRELENAIERAVALCLGQVITRQDLPPSVLNGARSPDPAANDQHVGNLTLKELERRHIAATLRANNWNYDLVTKILGIGRTTLWRKMKEYQIANVKSTNGQAERG